MFINIRHNCKHLTICKKQFSLIKLSVFDKNFAILGRDEKIFSFDTKLVKKPKPGISLKNAEMFAEVMPLRNCLYLAPK